MDTDRKAIIFNGFGLLASLAILISGAIIPQTIVDLLVQIFGLLLIIWAVITLKANNVKNQYLPKGYFFLYKGPYEIVRHPIYAGYLLLMISIIEIDFSLVRLVAIVILAIVIFMKILREEHTMLHEIKEYKEYMKKTKAIIPYLL